MALISANFVDVLDIRFQKIWDERFRQLPDRVSDFYAMKDERQQVARFSTVGTLGDVPDLTGTITYDEIYQGYDTSITPLEFASGLQIERRLFDDGMHNIIDQKPKALAGAIYRLRQAHAARSFVNSFSVDTKFSTNTEGVALCSNSHTTTATGVSTATGFDNLRTAALSAVSLSAARIDMVNFRGDRAERISIAPDELLIPPDLYETAYEIVGSMGKVDTANNNANVHYGQYKIQEWNYLTDTNDWWLMDSSMRKDFGLCWIDKVKGEFGFVEDFDSLTGKWRAYARWGMGWIDWRWVLGNSVS
ncbi:MAG: Mu-like prophage major head subunit gpT family protein [Nitrososphaerales archaeon]